jgi:hypothetical protein
MREAKQAEPENRSTKSGDIMASLWVSRAWLVNNVFLRPLPWTLHIEHFASLITVTSHSTHDIALAVALRAPLPPPRKKHPPELCFGASWRPTTTPRPVLQHASTPVHDMGWQQPRHWGGMIFARTTPTYNLICALDSLTCTTTTCAQRADEHSIITNHSLY